MKWPTWILSGLALALFVAVALMVSRQASTSPQDFFAEVVRRIEAGRYDREQTLLQLEQVLERAGEAGDEQLMTDVLLRRGRLLLELGAWDRARADLEAVSARRPDDELLEESLVELETRAGDFAAAELRVRRAMERTPAVPAPWVRLGRVQRLAALQAARDACALLQPLVPPSEFDGARAWVEQAVALDPASPERVALLEHIASLGRGGDEADAQEALLLVDRGSERTASARAAWAESLGRGFTLEALTGLIDAHRAAGEHRLAVDLATCTLRRPEVKDDAHLARAIVESLTELGRVQQAADLAGVLIASDLRLDPTFLELCARVAVEARRWQVVFDAGAALQRIGNPTQQSHANFYMGYPMVQLGGYADGRARLRSYLAAKVPEPVENAEALAWQAVARASRALEEQQAEREALQGALQLDPELSGEDWLRLAELSLQTSHGGYSLPEKAFARGMGLMPERTEELVERWKQIGELELSSMGFDALAVRQALVERRVWRPSADATPYELYRLAQLHLEADDLPRARNHARRILEIVPGFVPALDFSIEIAQLTERDPTLLPLVSERVQLAGRTDVIAPILADVEIASLPAHELLALMRADPEVIGRAAAARALAERGELAQALALASSIEPGSGGGEAALAAAALHLELGDPDAAWKVLDATGLPLGLTKADAPLAARAAAWSKRETELYQVLERAATSPALGRAQLLELVDVALAVGDEAAATSIIGRLDSEVAARGGDLLLRLAQGSALVGAPEGVALALARAEAFPTRGGAQRVALLAAAHAGAWDRTKLLAADLLASRATLGPHATVAALALAGQDEDAAERLRALAEQPGDANGLEALLAACLDARGRTVAAHDDWIGPQAAQEARTFARASEKAREALMVIVALDDPLGSPFARVALDASSPPIHGMTWPRWLAALQAAAAGDRGRALWFARVLCAENPSFGPAWELAERLQPELARDYPAYAELRAQRLAALGDRAGTESEVRVDRARALQAAGEHEKALRPLTRAVADHPHPAEVERLRARSLAAIGRPLDAVSALAAALTATPPPFDVSACVREFAAAFDAALIEGKAVELDDPLARAALVWPDDARLALLRARLDLVADPKNPALCVQRALARLRSFRASHPKRALDRLAPGSAAEWAAFLVVLDLELARSLVREELAMAPGELGTWAAGARVAAAAGDRDEALRELKLLRRIRDDAPTRRMQLAIAGAGDLAPEEISAAVLEIARLEGREAPEASLRVLAARALLDQGPKHAAQALAAVDELSARAEPRADVAREARLYAGMALIARGQPGDAQRASALLAEVSALPHEGSLRDFMAALRGLAQSGG